MSKNNLRGITFGIRPIRGIKCHSIPFINSYGNPLVEKERAGVTLEARYCTRGFAREEIGIP